MTPILGFVEFGQEHLIDTESGPNSMVRKPGGGWGFGTSWVTTAEALGIAKEHSTSITIRGNVIPEPNSFGLLIGGLFAASGFRNRSRES